MVSLASTIVSRNQLTLFSLLRRPLQYFIQDYRSDNHPGPNAQVSGVFYGRVLWPRVDP